MDKRAGCFAYLWFVICVLLCFGLFDLPLAVIGGLYSVIVAFSLTSSAILLFIIRNWNSEFRIVK